MIEPEDTSWYELSEQGEVIPMYVDNPNVEVDPDWFED